MVIDMIILLNLTGWVSVMIAVILLVINSVGLHKRNKFMENNRPEHIDRYKCTDEELNQYNEDVDIYFEKLDIFEKKLNRTHIVGVWLSVIAMACFFTSILLNLYFK